MTSWSVDFGCVVCAVTSLRETPGKREGVMFGVSGKLRESEDVAGASAGKSETEGLE